MAESNREEEREMLLPIDSKYAFMKGKLSSKTMHQLEKKIATKIALKEKTSHIHKKLKKYGGIISVLHKRLHHYSKERKHLKIVYSKVLAHKKAAILKIKQLPILIQKSKTAQVEALKQLQKKQAHKIVRDVQRQLSGIKRTLKHLDSKKMSMRRKIALYKGISKKYRVKLTLLLKEKTEYMKKLAIRRAALLKKQVRYYKVFALFKSIKKAIKHQEERLNVEVNEVKREKLRQNVAFLHNKRHEIKKRITILKRRKAEQKARKLEMKKTKQQIHEYSKKYHAEKKLKKAALSATKKEIKYLKRQYKKAERSYNNARDLVKRERKATALKGARMAYFAALTKAYNLKKDIRDLKNISIQKIHAVVRGLYKLQIIDANMRITEHKLSIKEYEMYKKKVVKRISVLKKYGKRLDLCPRNQHLLKKQLKLNYRRLRHVNRKIRHSENGIRHNNEKIGHVHMKLRKLAIREYHHMKHIAGDIKQTIKQLKTNIKANHYTMACSGSVTRRRLHYLNKKFKNEIKSLLVEYNELKYKIKRVDDAIVEEKKQRLTITKIDYHRAKHSLAETKHAIRHIARKIQKNKELATAAEQPYERARYLRRNASLTKKLVRLDKITKVLKDKVGMLKVRYNKLKQQELTEFLNHKTKWETRRDKVRVELKSLAKKEAKLSARLKKSVCEAKKCRLFYNRKVLFLNAHKLQIVLYRIEKKLEKINAEYVRRSEAKSFKMIAKRFLVQKLAYRKSVHIIKHLTHQMSRLEKKISSTESRLPYLADKEKIIAKGVVASLEKIKRHVQKKLNFENAEKIRTMKKYLAINKQYIIQLKKRMESDQKRKKELVKERPDVLHEALYELIPRKQQHAERKLNKLDKELDHLERRNSNDIHNLKEATKTRAFMKEAVKPKVQCTTGIINCQYCKSLGRIVKKSLNLHENDRVILERLQHRCSKEIPDRQTQCLDVAMRLSEYAVNVFDPIKFRVAGACKKIGVCGI
ncbi:DNA double-strand break repair Rad50 ATPase [Entamoeba marina]